ncbi:CvpA family protein [Cysteiniphilum sp. JM-1]|uniref:CvpA family protein n=1 Tax=Cysteiniphilum sp. JM-1 TaxID=2610891 RepID=UPI001247B559|nr:CvpA family protein [Cysteiniphilum sp. JM-1]
MSLLNWLDWIFIIIVFGFAIIGFSQGFVRGLISLLTWLIAAVSAYFFADSLDMNFAAKWFNSPEVAFWMSFFAIVVIVWILGGIVHIIFGVFRKDNQTVTDRLLGFLFGIVKSTLVVSLIVGVLSYNKALTEQKAWQDSLLVPWLVKGAVWVDHKLPEDVHQKIHNNSIYKYNPNDKNSDEGKPATDNNDAQNNSNGYQEQEFHKSKAELDAIG